jgi:hypothetical protein
MACLVVAAGLGVLVTGVALLLQWRQVEAEVRAYLDSPCTRRPVAGTCSNVDDAIVLGTATPVDPVGGVHALVGLVAGTARTPLVVEGVWPDDAFHALHPGAHVLVIRTHGRPVTLRLDPDSGHPLGLRLWTVDNPQPDQDLLRDCALSAAGVGLLALALVAPARLTRLSRRPAADLLGDRWLRWAMLGFTVVELLDVATSVAGRHHLLYEGVAVTRAVVAPWGDAGFLAVKLPALLALGLLVARLPRRWGMVPVLVAGAAVALVVTGNLRLLAGGTTG